MIINSFNELRFVEKLKNDLWLDFLSLEQNRFFDKETLQRKKIDTEKDPYARQLNEEEYTFFQGIFENYFTEWYSQLKNYFDLFQRIELIFNMYAKPVTPILKKEKTSETSFPYRQDVINHIEYFFKELRKLYEPQNFGVFRTLYNIVEKNSYEVQFTANGEKKECAYNDRLHLQLEEEILFNIYDLDTLKVEHYYFFLKNKLQFDFDKIDTEIINSFDELGYNSESYINIKELLRIGFNDEINTGFLRYSGEYDLNNKSENEEKFDNYFNSWFSRLQEYIDLYKNIKNIYQKYVNSKNHSKVVKEEKINKKDQLLNILDLEKTITKLVKFLTPNSIPTDIDDIEKNITEISNLVDVMRSRNIFRDLELCLFEYDKQKIEPLVWRLENSLNESLTQWKKYYNEQTFETAQHKKILYRSTDLKHIILGTNSLISNIKNEISRFKELYLIGSIIKKDLQEEEPITDIKFKNPTHKISLLEQLGVIDFLKTQYPILKDNNTKLASLLGGILEITDKTEKDTLRKNLSYLDSNHKKTIRNEKSDREIRAELLKLGIEI